MRVATSGPLANVKVVEFRGLGPAPYAGMLLSDLGADVVLVDRPGARSDPYDVALRGRRSIVLDLKNEDDVGTAAALVGKSELLVEGFRPGVMERLGLGPDAMLARNPSLVYGRITGWGQQGPLAQTAGHDVNYIALTGALAAIGARDAKPTLPLNLVGDFGGGSLFLVIGLLAGLLEARKTGKGQVVDAAIVDGTVSLLHALFGKLARGDWSLERASNLVDGGAPFYNTYACADDKFMSVGCIEPQFYAEFREIMGLHDEMFHDQWDRARWDDMTARLERLFLTRPRDEWTAIFRNSDACVAPVLTLDEVAHHPHMAYRELLPEIDGVRQPAPAPRFSRTPGAMRRLPPRPGADRREIMVDWGLEAR